MTDTKLPDNIVKNPHMWIGDGYMYCSKCKGYRYYGAYSTKGVVPADCILICKTCHTEVNERDKK